ncbi:MAG: class I SAM-dependent methyltransferase [Candidatus Dojkabacteria bacterium]|nr:MAG: class I SAM-dependent methyltransferase [Candidatus Dojkabacteria bacterium]
MTNANNNDGNPPEQESSASFGSGNIKHFIANYELNDYTYDAFWAGREYEHLAEIHCISRLLQKYAPNQENKVIMDVGGAYGRLSPLYRDTFKHFVISDYSTIELRHAAKDLEKYKEKMNLVAMNVYKVPFQNDTFDTLMSVRLIHHIASPEIMMEEMYRILKPGGIFILEAAHKQHILGFFKALFQGKLSEFFANDPHRVAHNPSESQGIKEGQESIMFSFTADHIVEVAKSTGFSLKEVVACSFFRLPMVKKLFPTSLLLGLEKVAQALLSWTRITPSLLFVFEKPGILSASGASFAINDTLQCPHCSARMTYSQPDVLQCEKCKETFLVREDIFDLRDPKPEEVTF